MTAVATTGSAREGIEFRIDTSGLEEAFRLGPSSCYYWLRSFLFGAFLKHRLYWLGAKRTKFGRAGNDSNAIKVWRINEAPASGVRPNWVVYRVLPKAPRERDPSRAAVALMALEGVAAAGSVVLKVHQEGSDITSNKWMTVPLRTRERSPQAWRRAHPGKPLVVLQDKHNAGRLFLAERIRYRGKRAPGVTPRDPKKRKVVRDMLRRRFLLLKSVDMKPTLNFYESWDALRGERDTEFRNIASRIAQDIARGKLT